MWTHLVIMLNWEFLFSFWGWWINFLNHWMEFAFSGKLYIDVNLKLTHVRIWPEGYVRKGIKQWLLQSREVLGQCGELRGQKIIPVSKKTWNQHFYLERKHFFSFREKELNQKCYQSVLLKLAFNLKLTAWVSLWAGLTLPIKIQ